jgi:NAD(P)-dependent dehydrogenase (short-subunit alcohol dehydrogenase family)
MELSGKVALVTGASQGTGRAYALALAQAGATVFATSRTMGAPPPGEAPGPSTLAQTVRLSEMMGCRVHAALCDVSREDQIARTIEEIIGNHGRIDVVVNNAATYPADQPEPHLNALGFTAPEWRRYMDVNVIGPYLIIRAAAPYMIHQRSGSIINISSPAGRMEMLEPDDIKHRGMLGYGVTKAALDRMSMFFAAELKPYGIAVNSLSPGAVITHSWREIPKDKLEEYERAGKAKPPTVEVMGPSIVFMAQQTASTLSGRILDTDDYPAVWP